MLKTLITALVLVALAATAAAPAAPAKAKPKPTCKRSHSITVHENRVARVFTRPGHDGYTAGTDLLGCLKKTGRVRLLAYAFDDDYVSRADFALVRLRGQFAAFYTESYDISCKASCDPDYQPTHRFLHLVDLRRGTGYTSEIAERPAGNRLLLDARGAIAWPRWLPGNQVEVRAVDAGGERVIDAGAIRPESLSLSAGGLLGWVNDGTLRTTRLRRFVT